MTVEEFIENYNFEKETQYSKYDTNPDVMIAFAKHHIEKVSEEILKNSPYKGADYLSYEDVTDIIKSYKSDKIK